MNSSDKIDQVAASLYAVQRDLRNPPTDAAGQRKAARFRYASLPALLDYLRPKLDATSLAVLQYAGPGGAYTLVTHSSGQWLELGPYALAGGDDQERGASFTYARRYMLAALFRIAADDDPDPDAGTVKESAAPSPTQPPGSGGDGAAEDVTGAPYGEGGAPVATPVEEAQRLMDKYHPGKPHKRIKSDTVPGMIYCNIVHPSEGRCEFAIMVAR